MVSSAIAKINPATVFVQNASFFGTNLSPGIQVGLGSYFRIIIAVNVTCVIQITLDGGTTWDSLWSGQSLTNGQIYTLDVPVRNGDLVNYRTNTGGGTTIDVCRIDEIIEVT